MEQFLASCPHACSILSICGL